MHVGIPGVARLTRQVAIRLRPGDAEEMTAVHENFWLINPEPGGLKLNFTRDEGFKKRVFRRICGFSECTSPCNSLLSLSFDLVRPVARFSAEKPKPALKWKNPLPQGPARRQADGLTHRFC